MGVYCISQYIKYFYEVALLVLIPVKDSTKHSCQYDFSTQSPDCFKDVLFHVSFHVNFGYMGSETLTETIV